MAGAPPGRRRRPRAHVVVGVGALGLVLAHVVALFVLAPEDAGFAMSPDGPTRARMALLSLVLLVAVVVLGAARRRLGWSGQTFRLLHGGLAVLGGALGVGHAVLVDGALEGPGTAVLLVLGGVGLGGGCAGVVLRARRHAPEAAPDETPTPDQAPTGSGIGNSPSSAPTADRSPSTVSMPSATAPSSGWPR